MRACGCPVVVILLIISVKTRPGRPILLQQNDDNVDTARTVNASVQYGRRPAPCNKHRLCKLHVSNISYAVRT